MSAGSECQVRLHRDALSTQWGFRLQGGKDFKTPLTVQRVFVGSPADGELHRGDVIVSIDNYDATQMIHKQAQDIIKQAGGTMSLRIKRSVGGIRAVPPPVHIPTPTYSSIPASASQFRSRPLENIGSPPSHPTGTMYGHDYSYPQHHKQQPRMMSNVNRNLQHVVVGQAIQRPLSYNTKPAWVKPEPFHPVPSGLEEPGWTPKSGNWAPVRAPQASKYQPLPKPQYHNAPPQPINARPVATQPPRHIEPETPAWQGTLKSSGGSKPWEMREAEAIAGPGVVPPRPQHRPQHQHEYHPEAHQPAHVPVHQPRVQNMHYGPGDTAPTYSQSNTSDSDTAQIKHLQYNSPLGLYSRENVQAALQGQTHGKPGQGTMQVVGGGGPGVKQYDPNKSNVLKLLHEEEQSRRGPAGAPPQMSARYQDPSATNQGEMHYEGYMDHSKQSPAMGRLEQRIADGTVGTDLGTSDF